MVSNGIKLVLAENMDALCMGLYSNTELIETLTKENFIIGVSEFVDSCISTFFSKIGAKTFIHLIPTAIHDSWYGAMGIVHSPATIPAVDEAFPSGDSMSYWERAWNLYCAYLDANVNGPPNEESFVSTVLFINFSV